MKDAIPQVIRPRPRTSSLFVVDERVPLSDILRALSESGLTVTNDHDGKLVVTNSPEDFRATAVSRHRQIR